MVVEPPDELEIVEEEKDKIEEEDTERVERALLYDKSRRSMSVLHPSER
jgi:hypothetical protein